MTANKGLGEDLWILLEIALHGALVRCSVQRCLQGRNLGRIDSDPVGTGCPVDSGSISVLTLSVQAPVASSTKLVLGREMKRVQCMRRLRSEA